VNNATLFKTLSQNNAWTNTDVEKYKAIGKCITRWWTIFEYYI